MCSILVVGGLTNLVDSYITALKKLAKSYEFRDEQNSLIRDRIVYKITRVETERLLRDPKLRLENTVYLPFVTY